MSRQQGFNLPETLVALVLYIVVLLALMKYQTALTVSFQRQMEQKLAWRYAWQRFEGYQPPGWQSWLTQQPAAAGCQLLTSEVVSPSGRRAKLTLLRCPQADDFASASVRGKVVAHRAIQQTRSRYVYRLSL